MAGHNLPPTPLRVNISENGIPIARKIGFIGMNHFTPKEGWVASNNVGISRMLYELW